MSNLTTASVRSKVNFELLEENRFWILSDT